MLQKLRNPVVDFLTQQLGCAMLIVFIWRMNWKKRLFRGQFGNETFSDICLDKLTRVSFFVLVFGPSLARFPRLRLPMLLYAYSYLDGSEKSGWGRPSSIILSLWRKTIIPFWRKYVKTDIIVTEPLKKDGRYLFACHPHGVLPLSMIVNYTSDKWNKNSLPDRDSMRVLVASACFYIPVLRDIYMALNFIDASRPSASRAVTKYGKNILIFVGGAAESFYFNKDQLVLRRHPGFLKFAMKHNLQIVPVFSFQENDTFKFSLEKGTLDFQIQSFFRKTIGICMPPPTMPLIPNTRTVTSVFGKPFEVPHLTDPDDAAVEEYLEKYIDQLKKLYDENKKFNYDFPDRELEFLDGDSRID